MKRSEACFPIKEDNILLDFLRRIWKEGWLDEYSDKHFLIRAIENRLTDFLGKQQAYRDNTILYPVINDDNFTINFLVNFSMKMNGLCNVFSEKDIKKFVMDQLSAGKNHYNEE